MLIKVLLNFFLPIPLDGKKRGNRGVFGKKAFSKAALLILPLHNFFEDTLLLLLLHLLIVSSSFRLFAAKLGVGVFGKDDLGITADDPGTKTGADVGADNPSIGIDNLGTEINADAGADNSGTAADDPGTETDAEARIDDPGTTTDNPGTTADNPGIDTDAEAKADDLGTVASNKARARTASLFALRHALFLLTSSSELVTVSLPFSSPSSSETTLQSKPVLSCLVTLVK